jgi:hypothetical protein
MKLGRDRGDTLTVCDSQDRAGMLNLKEGSAPTARNVLQRPHIGWRKNQRTRLSTAHRKSSMKDKVNPFTILAWLISCMTSWQGH